MRGVETVNIATEQLKKIINTATIRKRIIENYYSKSFNSIEFNGTIRTFVTNLPVEKLRDETEEDLQDKYCKKAQKSCG